MDDNFEVADVFYMVYVQGGHSPTIKHTSRRSASIEAERLTKATKMPTYVLKAVGMFYAVKVTEPTYAVKGLSLHEA